jgi:dTDP-4-dehydrorhamnose 3,5-epimerase
MKSQWQPKLRAAGQQRNTRSHEQAGFLRIRHLEIDDIVLIELDRYTDERGWFMELWNPSRAAIPSLPTTFVQDNIAHSGRGVLRGLHFQWPHGQGKLVTVADGEIFDVAVDVRPGSKSFGVWQGVTLVPGMALYIPEGFAHGYQVTSESATVIYKCTSSYRPECEHAVRWDDPAIGIDWPLREPILSPKDRTARTLAETSAVLDRVDAGL